MVSIPDWTKFQRLHDMQKEPSNVGALTKYYKQREEETIRMAENQGLLRTPTQEFLVKNCGTLNGKYIKDVSQLRLVKLCGVHLRKIGDMNYCINLKICILNNNFLTKIDGLAACRQLVKLDLHGNQISTVPGIAFWSGLRQLKFLHLHDNPLGKYENLQNLGTCPNLIALTLYDTPISLKRNYRHHVVNSIWSLKALDSHVISDEEIIEDAMFGGRFGTKHPEFRCTLFFHTPQHYTFVEEMNLVQQTQARINHILAHHSPVLIVQKFMRGFLTRKMYGKARRRLKSAGGSALPIIPSDQVPPPPSTSPAFGNTSSAQDIVSQGDVTLDYESFIKSRRPESSAPSESTSYQRREQVEGYQGPFPTPMDHHYDETPGSPSDILAEGSPRKRKNLHINLAKLQTGTFSSIYNEQIAIETVLPQEMAKKSDQSLDKKLKKKKPAQPVKKVVKSVKQFFGPVVESTPTPDIERQEEDEEAPVTKYRLRGFQPNIILIDPMTEMILTKQEAGRVVRDAEVEHHRKLQDAPSPKAKSQAKNMNNDQRIFARVHGTMGMSCLFAVHQAYKDREKAEKTASKMEYILSMREERDRAKERIKMYHDEKRTNALKQRDLERAKTLESLERREMMRLNYLDRRHEVKNKSTDLTKSYRADYTFITEFSNQHTSVSKALMRHDRQAKYEDHIQSKTDFVQSQSASENEQRETVKKYLEHRQLMRQTESAMARAALDTRMLQEANDRMIEAKTRVAKQKARQDTVQSFYPLPVMTPLPTANSAPPVIAHGLTRWETNILISHGRIGRHPTMVT